MQNEHLLCDSMRKLVRKKTQGYANPTDGTGLCIYYNAIYFYPYFMYSRSTDKVCCQQNAASCQQQPPTSPYWSLDCIKRPCQVTDLHLLGFVSTFSEVHTKTQSTNDTFLRTYPKDQSDTFMYLLFRHDYL
jgi:hypothetical protein